MKNYLKSLIILIKDDEIINFNFLIKDKNSEIFEKKQQEFLQKRETRLNIQILTFLLVFWNYLNNFAINESYF
jgi:hypothetical protein